MKNFIKVSGVFLVIVFGFFLGVMGGYPKTIYAEETATENTVTDAEYTQVWVNDLSGFVHSGATYNATTNSVTTLKSGGRIGYTCGFENVEISLVVNASTFSSGNINFHLRLIGDVQNNSYTRKGYQFRWYKNGQYEILKNGTKLVGPKTGAPSVALNTDYTVKYSTINQSDGSVKMTMVIGSKTIEYVDSTDVISGSGMFAITTSGATISVSGQGFSEQAINPWDISNPVTNANFPGTVINEDKSINFKSGTIANGVAFGFQTDGYFSYKFKFTPTTNTGKLRMTIGSKGTLHRDDIVGDNAWSETGYVLQWWGDGGQRHLFRNGVLLNNGWNLPNFEANKTYEVEYGITYFGSDCTRLHLKIDGVFEYIYFDRTQDDYTPLTITSGSSPASLYRNVLVSGIGVDGTITESQNIVEFDEKTILNNSLGEPAKFSSAEFDRNGGITKIVTGRNAGYNGNFKNVSIKMLGNFTAGGCLIFQLRGQSTVFDTPWGSSWTNRGYAIYIYSNGQTILTKNGATICEGFSLSSMTLSMNTNYVFEIGTINVTDTKVRVFAKINDTNIINYLDTNDTIDNEGWFTIFNNQGFAGSLMPYGIEYPQVVTDIEGEFATINNPVTLSYSMTEKPQTETVEYFINEETTTAEATITNNQLVATSVGVVDVYVCVNGIYSNDISIEIREPAVSSLINVPITITFGQPNITIDAKMSDDSDITTKVFGIINVSGEAEINAETGEITPIKAGTIKVFAEVNGVKTSEAQIIILPVITVTQPTRMVVSEKSTIEYISNCPLPTEEITVIYEIVSGDDIATINALTGEVSAVKVGGFTVKVTLTCDSFEVESEVLAVEVVCPILINLPTAPLVVGGEKFSVDAKMSDNGFYTTKIFNLISISGDAEIDSETGEITPIKAGTIKVYAVVDGFKTEEYIIFLTPKIFINKVGSFAFGGEYDLNEYYGANCELPNEEINVVFELVDGSEYAVLDITTGILTVGNNPGKIKLKVYIVGETFSASSSAVEISVERPIVVVQNSFLGDLYVGQSVTLVPSISQGGVAIEQADIVIISGGDCVEINGMTITAIKAGTFKYDILINEQWTTNDEGLEIAIELLVPTIIANSEMFVGTVQQAGIILNSLDYIYSEVMWSVVNGDENVSVSDDGKISALKQGQATIKVVVDGLYESTIDIVIHNNVILLGVAQGATVLVGGSLNLSYKLNEEDSSTEQVVEYAIVEGHDCVVLTQDGKLEAVKSGTVKIKVIVNGNESQIVTFNILQNKVDEDFDENRNRIILWIVLGSCFGGLLGVSSVILMVIFMRKNAKVKNVNIATVETETNNENFITVDKTKKTQSKKKSKRGKENEK